MLGEETLKEATSKEEVNKVAPHPMARGTSPKTERNNMIVALRDKALQPGEKRMSFAAIGAECRPKITAQFAHEIYTREKKKLEKENGHATSKQSKS